MANAPNSLSKLPDRNLRFAEHRDVDSLVRLINAAFVVEQVAIEGDRVNFKKVRDYMQTGKFLLLEESPAILGCVFVEKRGGRGFLGLLSVEPHLQGKGFGRQLTHAAEKLLRDMGCSAVDLRVISARSELLSFYGKLGYAETGTSPMPADAPLKIPCHFIHMAKPLL
jgi:GNAT superfamily N-acetyltransferase